MCGTMRVDTIGRSYAAPIGARRTETNCRTVQGLSMFNISDLLTVESISPLRVMSLHALLYCERLFYVEGVEEIRVADATVYAGRRHQRICSSMVTKTQSVHIRCMVRFYTA